MSPPAGVPILRFRVGGVPCALAATSVASFSAAAGGRHVREILGLPEPPLISGERWLVRVAGRRSSLDVVVDGPVEFDELSARDVLERPPGLALAGNHPVLGFARRGDEIVVLLDAAGIVELGSRR